MAISTAMCTSFKVEILEAKHDFTASTGHTYNLALFKGSVSTTFGAGTTNYSAMGTDEASGTGYTAGGKATTNTTPTSTGTTAFTTPSADVSWTSASFTTSGALLFLAPTATGNAVATFFFGGDQTVSSGTLTVLMPTNDATTGLIRLA